VTVLQFNPFMEICTISHIITIIIPSISQPGNGQEAVIENAITEKVKEETWKRKYEKHINTDKKISIM
jgi:hypothetical protein